MPLEVRPAGVEDAYTAADLHRLAFEHDELERIFYPAGADDDVRREHHARELIGELQADPRNHWVKVVETGGGGGDETVAFSHWLVVERPDDTPPTATAAATAAAAANAFGPGANEAACAAFAAARTAVKGRHTAGRTYVYLRLLVTHPAHQRRGAGGLLVDWGVGVANQLGLPAMLIATPDGHRLYRERGFRDVEPIPFDCRRWGGRAVRTCWFMERPARST